MDLAKEINRSVSRMERRVPRRRGAMRLSMFDNPVSLPDRQRGRPEQPKERKLVSLEVELGGMAVEFKARNLAGLLAWLSIDAALAAVIQELSRPRQFRTWHGRVAGLIPYDFRRPTLRRLLDAFWAPDNPRLFTDTAFGVGWSVNLAQLPRALAGVKRPAPSQQPYEAPSMESKV